MLPTQTGAFGPGPAAAAAAAAALLPRHQGPVLADAKLCVLHPAAVPHQPAVAHDVAQTLALAGVEEARVLGEQAARRRRRLLHRGPVVEPAAPRPPRLQHRQGPQGVMDRGHVT